jgi:hypothetical protein
MAEGFVGFVKRESLDCCIRSVVGFDSVGSCCVQAMDDRQLCDCRAIRGYDGASSVTERRGESSFVEPGDRDQRGGHFRCVYDIFHRHPCRF